MKSIFTLLFLTIILYLPGNSQIVYVNHNASGSNNGTTWANAYTSLSSAIADQSANEIWIAAGTYLPGADTSATFTINRPLKIYGGFEGTESELNQRDVELYPVVLSGDILGDDIPGNLSANRSDNSRHIIFVENFSGGSFELDGVTIRGGTNNDFIENASSDFVYRGAGIYALSPCAIRNCSFFENICYSGAAVFLRDANTSGSTIEDCTFWGNESIGQGIVFALRSSNLDFVRLNFESNASARGCIYPNECQSVLIDNCQFLDNAYPGGYGCAFFNWHSMDILIKNSHFESNQAGNGAGIYVDQRDLALVNKPPSIFRIEGCTFRANTTTDYGGGALYAFRASYAVDNCEFSQNSGANSGGAIVNSGADKRYEIRNSTFENNTAGFGGAANNYGENTMAMYKNCVFKNNSSGTSGGALINGFKATVKIENCSFESNNARWGGAMYCQNDTTAVEIKDSRFFSNASDNFGGAINVFGGIDILLESSSFEANESDFGGAVAIGRDTNALGTFELKRNIFNFNLASTQGGAINFNNAKGNLENNLFVNNIASGDGIGGALSTNAFLETGLEISLVNNTFTDNIGELADAFTAFTDSVTNSDIELLNNVFYNINSTNFVVESGNPTLVSAGGNFSNDGSLMNWLNASSDINNDNSDPDFVDAANFDYHIGAMSPFVDAAAQGGPTIDLDGNQRDASPDIGCYEYGASSAVSNVFNKIPSIQCIPNPASAYSIITAELLLLQDVEITILDETGKVKMHAAQPAHKGLNTWKLDVKDWPSGVYILRIKQGNFYGISKLIKA